MPRPTSRLEKVPLREIWPNEAHDFTVWLGDNLDLLSELLGRNLSLVQREAAVGPFWADIVAEDANGAVIIENQLDRTDHDHLGKIITYLSNLDAKTAVWISRQPQPEHEKAVHWLNEFSASDTSVYLVKVEAYRIGESLPAPLFSIVAGPSVQAKQIGRGKEELAERHIQRLEFWKQLLNRAKLVTNLHARISPGKENWISAGAGISGLGWSYVIRMNDAQVELYVDTGDGDANKRIFDTIKSDQAQIEALFGGPLDWQRLDESRGSRVRHLLTSGGLRNTERWVALQDSMIEAMVQLHKALSPSITRLRKLGNIPPEAGVPGT